MNNIETGKHIVFDGIGACGKDTQVDMFQKYLTDEGIDVLVTREHTRDTEIGKLIEKIIKGKLNADKVEGEAHEKSVNSQALQLLYISDRRNHFTGVIEPALNEGKTVVSNRFYPVNVAYTAPEWRETFLKINQMMVSRPDLVLILDIDPNDALERMSKRGDHDIFDRLDTMIECRKGFDWYVKNSGDKCEIIDAKGTKEEVFERVVEAVKRHNLI